MGNDTPISAPPSGFQVWKNVIGLFLTTRPFIVILAYFANLRLEKFKYYIKYNHGLDPLFQWDSPYYLSIVKGGYFYNPDRASNVAFFPLYPLLVKLMSLIVGDPILAGFVVSNLCLLGAAFFLFKLCVNEGWGERVSRRVVLFMYIFPTGFFASMYYTEGLFLLLTTAAFYFARGKKWFWASLMGMLATGTRIFGLLLLFPLLAEYFGLHLRRPFIRSWKVDRRILWFGLIFLGLGAYVVYLYVKFGEPLAFLKTQRYWSRTNFSFAGTWSTMMGNTLFNQWLYGGSLVVFILAVVLLCIYVSPASYACFIVAVMALIMTSGTFESLQRYVGSLFPVYMSFALWCERRYLLEVAITVGFSVLLALFVIMYSGGYPLY